MPQGGFTLEEQLSSVLQALQRLRAPFCPGEYDLHSLAAQALATGGIEYLHEVTLSPRCRIDFLAGAVGIEIKKGRPAPGRLAGQLARYAQSDRVKALIVLVERSAGLPARILGKPCVVLSANRLWGIAL